VYEVKGFNLGGYMFRSIRNFFSDLLDLGPLKVEDTPPPTGYEAPEFTIDPSEFDRNSSQPKSPRQVNADQVGKVFVGNSAFLKSKNTLPHPKYSTKMGSAVIQVLGYDDMDFNILVTATKKDGSIEEVLRDVRPSIYYDKISRGFLSEITDQQYDLIRDEMLKPQLAKNKVNPPKPQQVDVVLETFKANYAAHRAQQPTNNNVGVVVKEQTNDGVTSEKEYRGVDQIDAFIARAERKEVKLIEMIR
jgi:hypothetical protein